MCNHGLALLSGLIILQASLSSPALAQVAQAQGAPSVEELCSRISGLISDPRYSAAQWGIKIVTLEKGTVVFEHNSGQVLSPASNSKLYTVALALDRLGVDYRIKTSLYATAKPNAEGTLAGDLLVYGRGDPTVKARPVGRTVFEALQPFADALTNAGVKRIGGDLVGDASYFRGPEFGSGWTWDDQEYYYGAEISALTINDNLVVATVQPGETVGAPCEISFDPPASMLVVSNRTITAAQDAPRSITFYRLPSRNRLYVSGSLPLAAAPYKEDVTVHNPAKLFIALLAEVLKRNGIEIAGKLRTLNWLDREAAPAELESMVELGTVESLPMKDIAREIHKPSQNLYTDLILAHVGEQSRSPNSSPRLTSEDLGIRELNRFLIRAGVPRRQVFFEEGSGLSRNNVTTVGATIALLQFMARHEASGPYFDSLPVAGVDGTLRNRMKGTPAAGNVRAKTGTLRWANSLSGQVTTAAGEKLLFSIMLNRFSNPDPGTSSRAGLDAIAVELASFKGRIDPL